MNCFQIKRVAVNLVIFFGFLAAIFYVAGTKTTEAAYFQISPSSGSYYKGENFEAHILVNSDVAVNAVSGVLTFPTQYLEVVEINKKNSIINFWVGEPSFSNAGGVGNIRFEGVILNPGFTGSGGRIVNIIFRLDGKGAADVDFIQSAILANDGLGTNIVTSNAGAKFILLPQRPFPAQEQNQAKESAPQPQTIIIRELPDKTLSGVLSFWEILPNWVKASVLIFIGLATIVFSFIILSFGVIVLIWLWSNVWRRRYQFLDLLSLAVKISKNFVFKALNFLGMAEREIKEDIKYSSSRLIKEFKKAPQASSFKNLVKGYFFLVSNIMKRFFTRNVNDIEK